uniref:ABC transporter domain-containing protein n=1 Tax=Proboscia inermis TaxID=420281 RepID=A0A7S0CAU6_9STRA|mmetsp:Transcript_62364/g.72958  ORF Transcript_62364/g.72958 Transcript_62364/m.72958 type:complete len:553 (-) Transcript_62364:277-1935(-)
MSLAGKMKSNGSVQLSGSRYVNGIPVPEDGILPSAFVRQEVNFFPHMTVKETLDFRVDLKVGKTLGKSARDDIVKDLMETLALTKSANTIVGNSKIRGISGGERKRLSIACEMISSPPMIFLDEPTTGLDSFQATQVCRTLRNLADSGKTIIAVIHQPSQTAFALFDDLLLLSEGQQMYFGETSKARSYFQSLGYAPVTDVGTAEFVSDVISTTYSGGTGDREIDIARCNDIAIKGKEQSQRIKLSNVDQSVTSKATQKIFDNFKSLSFRKPAANIFKQFRLLMVRSLQEVFRGKATLLIKVTQQITLGLIYGGIYQLGNNQASIQDRVGLLSLVAIGITNMAVAGTIRSFPKEKVIVTEEMSSGLYGTFPYFVAKAISEIPPVALFSAAFSCVLYPLTGLQPEKFVTFLGLTTLHSIASEGVGLMIGAVSASADIALALFPPLIVLNIIFDGKNISEESTPKLLRWIPKIGLIKNTFEGLVLNEFSGLEFESSGFRGPAAKNGAEALARFGITTTVKNVMKAQVTLIAGSWLLSFVGLSLTKDKFQVMKRP